MRHNGVDNKLVRFFSDVFLVCYVRRSQFSFGLRPFQLLVYIRRSSLCRYVSLVDLLLVFLLSDWHMRVVRGLRDGVVNEGRLGDRWLNIVLYLGRILPSWCANDARS